MLAMHDAGMHAASMRATILYGSLSCVLPHASPHRCKPSPQPPLTPHPHPRPPILISNRISPLPRPATVATPHIVSGQLAAGLPWDPSVPALELPPETLDDGPLLPTLDDPDAGRVAAAASTSSSSPHAASSGAAGGGAAKRLVHVRYGYAALGGVDPEAAGRAASGATAADLLTGLMAPQPRLHPSRKFEPGQAYEPQDLNPFSPPQPRKRRQAVVAQRLRPQARRGRAERLTGPWARGAAACPSVPTQFPRARRLPPRHVPKVAC